MADEAQQRFLAMRGGNLPARRGLYEDQALLNAVPTLALARQSLSSARLRPVTPHYMDLSPDMSWAFSAMLRGELTPAEAVETIEGLFMNVLLASS
ncbi:MAG: hypothetical protein KDC54_12970, partial [Lewinella sp.]|nr:hypothetical protein [Lewinella sp.]